MSVIHEALKRAERERSAGLVPKPAVPGVSPAPPTRWRRPWAFIALGVPILLLTGWYLVYQRDRTRGVTADPAVVAAVPTLPPQPIDRQTISHPVEPISAVPAPEPARAPVADPDPERLNHQAVESFRGGRLEEARLLLEQALRLAPAMPEAHNNLGMVFQSQSRRAEAREAYLRALALLPGYPEALNNLGLAWIEEGNQSEAIRSFEKALASNPEYSSAHLNLAIVYDRLGKRTDAFRHYRKFLDNAGAGERELVSRVNERLRR
ncbi:MAG: tetratricopeptide repeat protein [Legionella sp.]|nr:tetratricopeptide repeat protein [Legionella sp.]